VVKLEVKNMKQLQTSWKTAKNRVSATHPGVKKILWSIMTRQRSEILTRLNRGMGWEEQPFKPYSEKYAEERIKNGMPIHRVDLQFTGIMMAAYKVREKEPGVVLLASFGRGKYGNESLLFGEIMQKHSYGIGVPQRDIQGFTKADRERAGRRFNAGLEEILRSVL
jgi:hypothetical protein